MLNADALLPLLPVLIGLVVLALIAVGLPRRGGHDKSPP